MKKGITKLFYLVDDFLKTLEEEKKEANQRRKKDWKIDDNSWLNRKRNNHDSTDISEISVPEF